MAPAPEQAYVALAPTVRLPTGTAPSAAQMLPSATAAPAQVNTPPCVLLAVHADATSVPSTISLSSTSSCASATSALVGATPGSDSPPLNVTLTVLPAHARLVMLSAVLTHAATPAASAAAAQPSLTVPGAQLVQVEEPSAHAPADSVA
jgi:hypothetical protein